MDAIKKAIYSARQGAPFMNDVWDSAESEYAALRADLATARQAMFDSIGFANARPGCECPICKWLAEHPQKGGRE